jgi:hypothetical protein
VTALADGEIFVAERALPVMTGHAALGATRRVMIKRFGRRHLPTLRHPGAYLMTFIAVDLRLMPGVTETYFECRHVLRRSRVTT